MYVPTRFPHRLLGSLYHREPHMLVTGGAVMVDLREAYTKEDVLARFCTALELVRC